MLSTGKTTAGQCLCQRVSCLYSRAASSGMKRPRWVKQSELGHGTNGIVVSQLLGFCWFCFGVFLLVFFFFFFFNNENFDLGREEELVKLHWVILGRKDMKKKKGIVAKSLWQRAEKNLLKSLWRLECHSSWLQLFPPLPPFAESCGVFNFSSAQRWWDSWAGWPSLTWGYAGPHGSEQCCATPRELK